MNIELKPIAEKKIEQLGGDVCGVLVRKDDRLAAVDEHGRVQWLQDDGGEYAAYLEGMNSHLKAELQAARAQQAGSGEALAERKKPLAVKRSKISAGNYKAVRQDGEVFIIQKGVVAKGWTIENQRTYKIDSAVDLSQANYMITNCVGKVCAQSDHFGAATIPAGWHIHRYSDRMSMAHDSKRFPHRSFLFGGDDSQAMIAEFLSDLAFSAPQPTQQGSVPEGDTLKQAARYRWLRDNKHLDAWWSVEGPADRCDNIDRDIDEAMAQILRPEGDGWVKCRDKDPSNSDGYKVWFVHGICPPMLVSPAVLRRSIDKKGLWKPTGLKRPQPPAGQEGEGDE